MKKVENCKLISKTEIIDGIFDFVIESEDISKEAQCGQFLHINCGDSTFLRRPIIGGGIGVFPLYKLAKNINADVFLGFRSKDRVVMEDEFSDVSNMVIVGTDDGSYGYNGYIASAMEQYLDSHKCDMIYSCGPMPMLKAVKKIAENRGIKCQVSLEQRMGCGIGACLVCSCETNKEGTDRYAKVCTNGPVFYSEEVTLND